MKGRKPKIEQKSTNRFVAAYKVHKSARKVAEIFNVSHTTVIRHLKRAGIERASVGRHKGSKGRREHSASIVKWLRAHPGAVLPTSVKGIQAMTGCTYDSISCYLYRRRKVIRDLIKQFPDMKKIYVALATSTVPETEFSSQKLVKYEIYLDKWKLIAILEGQLDDGRWVKAHLSAKELRMIIHHGASPE
jgi:transposase